MLYVCIWAKHYIYLHFTYIIYLIFHICFHCNWMGIHTTSEIKVWNVIPLLLLFQMPCFSTLFTIKGVFKHWKQALAKTALMFPSVLLNFRWILPDFRPHLPFLPVLTLENLKLWILFLTSWDVILVLASCQFYSPEMAFSRTGNHLSKMSSKR